MNTHTKSGLLTEYGFSCGYVERAKGLPKGDVWMYKEHNMITHLSTRHGENSTMRNYQFDEKSEALRFVRIFKLSPHHWTMGQRGKVNVLTLLFI